MPLEVSVGKWRSWNLNLNLFDAKAWGLPANLGDPLPPTSPTPRCTVLENVTKAR